MTRAEWLAVSAERDLWLRRLLAAEQEAYERGRARGVEEGRRDALAEEAAQRREAAGLMPAGLSHAELERMRWGAAGREHFGDPRPGDYPGLAAAAA
jgi:hypothetical protein